MEQKLLIKGTQNFMGVEIPIIEGGFGEGQKVILAKTIAEIHETELKRINELINNNIEEFEIGIDLLDLCSKDFKVVATDLGFITSNGQKHCYLLSEQGYMLLVGFMKTDKAKEIRKQLRREYFAMREIINNDEQLKANLLLSIYNGGQDAIVASKQLTELEKKPLLDKIEEQKPMVDFVNTIGESSDSIDMGKFAKLVKDDNVFKGGRNKLFEHLRNEKYLMKDNIPYQKYIDMGIFEIIETTYRTPYGVKTGTKTLVTGKGQIYLVEKLRKENN